MDFLTKTLINIISSKNTLNEVVRLKHVQNIPYNNVNHIIVASWEHYNNITLSKLQFCWKWQNFSIYNQKTHFARTF